MLEKGYDNAVIPIRDDVFEILRKECALLYYPLEDDKVKGCHTERKVGENTRQLVFINTRYSVGKLRKLDVLVELSWEKRGSIINRNEFYSEVNYDNTEAIQIKGIVPPAGARSLYIYL